MTEEEFRSGVMADGTRLMQPPVAPVWRFDFGSTVWPGLYKWMEETHEAGTIVAKIMENEGKNVYFDGTDLRARLHEEIADQLAAIQFLIVANNMDIDMIEARAQQKLQRFGEWHMETLASRGGNVVPMAEPAPYSVDWLKRLLISTGAGTLDASKCHACGQVRFWSFEADMQTVWMNSGCFCGPCPPIQSGYDEIIEWLADMPDDAARAAAMLGLR